MPSSSSLDQSDDHNDDDDIILETDSENDSVDVNDGKQDSSDANSSTSSLSSDLAPPTKKPFAPPPEFHLVNSDAAVVKKLSDKLANKELWLLRVPAGSDIKAIQSLSQNKVTCTAGNELSVRETEASPDYRLLLPEGASYKYTRSLKPTRQFELSYDVGVSTHADEAPEHRHQRQQPTALLSRFKPMTLQQASAKETRPLPSTYSKMPFYQHPGANAEHKDISKKEKKRSKQGHEKALPKDREMEHKHKKEKALRNGEPATSQTVNIDASNLHASPSQIVPGSPHKRKAGIAESDEDGRKRRRAERREKRKSQAIGV